MKQISKSLLKETITKEYAEAHNWCEQDFGRYYTMNINVETGNIWSDVFLDVNHWKEYKTKDVRSLYIRGDMLTFEEIVDDYLVDACKKLLKHGWTIVD